MAQPPADFARNKARLDESIIRYNALIAQSNARAGSIAQKSSAVIGLIAILAAVATTLGARPNTFTYLLMMLTAVSIITSLIGLAGNMWPRMKGMPKDETVQAYQARLEGEALLAEMQLDYDAGLRLQSIFWVKEDCARVSLVSLITMAIFAMCAFFTLAVPS